MDCDTSKSATHDGLPRQTALVVVSGSSSDRDATPRAGFAIARPDPSFVTHLIATAAQMPQTRMLRRASMEDAQSSYRSVANQNKPSPAANCSGMSRVA